MTTVKKNGTKKGNEVFLGVDKNCERTQRAEAHKQEDRYVIDNKNDETGPDEIEQYVKKLETENNRK